MKVARRRKASNRTLPPNLYLGSHGHYKYRRPDTGKYYSLGTDRNEAVSAAKQLNSMLMSGRDLVEKVIGGSCLFSNFIDQFESKVMPERNLAIQTINEYKRKFIYIIKDLGKKPVDEISVLDIAEFLKQFPPVLSNRYRSLLSLIFKYAVAHGVCNDNPANKTISRKIYKKRKRLTIEGYAAVYEKADQWLKNAMEIGLHTLQRCEDIINLKFTDIKDGYLYVIQQKTKKHGDKAYIRAKIEISLQKIIDRCKDSMLSPYLIHRRPDRLSKQNAKAKSKKHYTQVTAEYLSKAFSAIRDQLGMFSKMDPDERPTFHEIRALGIKLYKEAGKDPQKLAGHFNSKMTEKYLEGHGINWTDTIAGLDLSSKGNNLKTA
jgi:hypothetical protein